MVCKQTILVYTSLIVLALPCWAQKKKAKIYFPLAYGLCHQFVEFGSTSVLQPPLKKAVDSGQPPSSQGAITWKDCNASNKCRPFLMAFTASSTIDADLLNILKQQQTANILIILKDTSVSILNEIKSRNLQDRAEKLNEAAKALKQFTANSQKSTLELLSQHERTKSLKIRAFWITNKIAVKGADLALVQELAKLPQISKIQEEFFIKISPPVNSTVHDDVEKGKDFRWNHTKYIWGVKSIHAPEVWAQGNKGEGITVGSVDTGVRGTHEALRDNFAGEYGWFDAVHGKSDPYDEAGHGTHVMARIVGTKLDVGVAPGALWTSCMACDGIKYMCESEDLITCAEFIACPTKADGSDPKCDKAPRVVNNSWGSPREGDPWYYDIIEYYHLVGIIPVFSIGNHGPTCCTTSTPGNYDNVIGVGAYQQDNKIWPESSPGPANATANTTGKIKPDMAAPGYMIYSAMHYDDEYYYPLSGTSCAAPHVSGSVALLLSKYPDLTYLQVKEALQSGCEPTTPSMRVSCGNISEEVYPNHLVGYGRINVLNSIGVAASIK